MSTSYVRAMTDAILGPLEHLMTSWWVYAALFGLCAVDALVPVFPSEAPLILAGVYAASDPHGPNVVLVVLEAAAQPVELDLSRFEGLVPVEVLGGVPFPRIGELPYLLTLSGYGFYWFRLTQAPGGHA